MARDSFSILQAQITDTSNGAQTLLSTGINLLSEIGQTASKAPVTGRQQWAVVHLFGAGSTTSTSTLQFKLQSSTDTTNGTNGTWTDLAYPANVATGIITLPIAAGTLAADVAAFAPRVINIPFMSFENKWVRLVCVATGGTTRQFTYEGYIAAAPVGIS